MLPSIGLFWHIFLFFFFKQGKQTGDAYTNLGLMYAEYIFFLTLPYLGT